MKKILIIEDDQILGESLSERLTQENYQVMLAPTLKIAKENIAEKFDLLLIDINLPDGNGLEFAKQLRDNEYSRNACAYDNAKNNSKTPIIFLTAMNTAEFRLEGFEIGAQDYIPKPFHLKELLLRIEKVFKNLNFNELEDNILGNFYFVDQGMIIQFKDGRKEFPQKKDYDLLKYLVAETPRIITREEILDKVWKEDSNAVSHRVVDNSIVRIRSILGSEESKLRSVRGQGYQWVEHRHPAC